MNEKATIHVTKLFEKYGVLFSLPEPTVEYITAVQTELSQRHWTLGRLRDALDYLKCSEEYNKSTKLRRYPTIFELVNADWIMQN